VAKLQKNAESHTIFPQIIVRAGEKTYQEHINISNILPWK